MAGIWKIQAFQFISLLSRVNFITLYDIMIFLKAAAAGPLAFPTPARMGRLLGDERLP